MKAARLLIAAALLCMTEAVRAENVAESGDFTIDTRDYGGGLVAESGDFTVDTITEGGSGPVDSGLFTLNTRAPDSGRGMGEAGDFTINTLGTGTPLALAGVTFSFSSTGAGTMRWTITVPPERAGVTPVFQISLNGGATWQPVTGLSSSGPLLAGANVRTWNYRAVLPADLLVPNPLLRVTINGLTGDYALPPVDTRPVTLASGRVLDALTGLPLAGVNVTAGSTPVTTDAQGRFSLPNPGASVTASRNGYENNTVPTAATGGTDARQLVVPDVRLTAASAGSPSVVAFRRDQQGYLLPLDSAVRQCAVELSGMVDWKGRAPGTVRLSHSGGWNFAATVSAASGGKSAFTALLNGSHYLLWSRLNERAPQVLAQATAGDGAQSTAVPLTLKAVKLPVWMKSSLEIGALTAEFDCTGVSAELELPPGMDDLERGLGLLGNYSFDPHFTAGFDMEFGTGAWELSLGGTQSRSYNRRPADDLGPAPCELEHQRHRARSG